MKKYLIASALIVGFITPALAEQFYVAFDPAKSQVHYDAQHTDWLDEKHGWPLCVESCGEEGHARHERVYGVGFPFAQESLRAGL